MAIAEDGPPAGWTTSDGKVAPRPVKLGAAQAGQWVVLSGLSAGEQVMVDGFQKLRGNAPVKAVPWKPAGPASATVAPAAPASAASPANR